MKKIIILSVLALFLLTACGNNETGNVQDEADYSGKDSDSNSEDSGSIVSGVLTDSEIKELEKISDAIALGKSAVCVVEANTELGTGKSTMYIKGKNMRVETVVEDYMSYVIFNNEVMYSWNVGGDEEIPAMKIDISKLDDSAIPQKGPTSSEDMAMQYDVPDYDVKCEVKSFSDSLLNPPSDIEFTDLAVIMNDLLAGRQ